MGIESKAWAIDKEYICEFSSYNPCPPIVLSYDRQLMINRNHDRVKVILIAKEPSHVEVMFEDDSIESAVYDLSRGEEKEYLITPEWTYSTYSVSGYVVFAAIDDARYGEEFIEQIKQAIKRIYL
ncbi:MAG: hypothetical protein F6K37_22810 [Moorea sp. SIO4E2]|uniref:hypothetical protein n=1 Tax=Moorena sp. SIO4E2 TaxID=2607826 RepID=UPI0013BA7EC6|nr:hypothetical protein [Moorena sp. SIO4E2]NEQ08675.1 hypothetical protein [Moorena sp. SIO4E2]